MSKAHSFSWMNPELIVQETKKCGKGIFTKENIKKGKMLSVFGGYIISTKEESDLPKKIQIIGVQISSEFILSKIKISKIEDADFFNHSCDPNAGFNGQLFLIAMRDIGKGEEVTFDYAMTLSKGKGMNYFKMRCNCGKLNCRKYVTDNDWKKAELQRRYTGYFQWYLQEKINKINSKK
jgi:SET domain-containing protein